MDLSIVIVNYNVKYFLEQCLHSVYRATDNLAIEVFVVDNNSVDGSVQMVKDKFPEVKLLVNHDNVGFSRANNQAIKQSKGKYVLLLNPDTVVQENTFRACFDFMERREKAGALGVKMINGKGDFLPESKRSLPTPGVAFSKIFGLSTLLPKSKLFGKYHLGYLDADKTHEVEVLAGAFMFIRKSVLDEIGLLDETFFMYGEDIDLSHRIEKAGYTNFYFPETTIIHYKGESTKKGSVNYVMVFYNAMIIFARKHFSKKNARIYSLLINLAIYFRAAISISRRFIQSISIPLLDATLIFSGFYFLSPFWEVYRFGQQQYYPIKYFVFVVPAYILVWLSSIFITGGYEKKVRPGYLIRGVLIGTFIILVIYALLPESLRFSRIQILLGSLWALICVFVTRLSIGIFSRSVVKLEFRKTKRRLAFIGKKKEVIRSEAILKKSEASFISMGRISIHQNKEEEGTLGTLSQINDIVKINKIDELVFCARDLKSEKIIKTMLDVTDSSIDFKIAPPESLSIIGSNSINTAGDLYEVNFNSLNKALNKRKKRGFDMLSAIIFLIFSPVLAVFQKRPFHFIINCLLVLSGFKTWVGLCLKEQNNSTIAHLRPGVLSPLDGTGRANVDDKFKERLDLVYVKDYKVINDLGILFAGFRNLGR